MKRAWWGIVVLGIVGGAVGSVPEKAAAQGCRSGLVKEGAQCFSPCPGGWSASPTDRFCYQSCPGGWGGSITHCHKPTNNLRKGFVAWDRGKCEKEFNAKCESIMGMWYPPCKEGTVGVPATGWCTAKCPDGFTEAGALCTRPRQNRTVENLLLPPPPPPPKAPPPGPAAAPPWTSPDPNVPGVADPKKKGDCEDGQEQWVGACYSPCPPGHSVYDWLGGDRCYCGCPPGYRDDATHCAKPNSWIGHPCPNGPGWVNIGVSCQKPIHVRKMAATKGAKKAGEAIVEGLKVVGETLCGPPCVIKKIVDVMGNETERNKWVRQMEDSLKTLADSLTNILFKFDPAEVGRQAGQFFVKMQAGLEGIMKGVEDVFLPRFFGLEILVRKAVTTVLSASTTPVVLLLGTVHWGVKQFLKWLIPEMIFVSGKAYGAAATDPIVKTIFDILKTLVGPVMGIVGNILKDKKAKIQEGVEKALKITEKIQDAAKKAIAAASAGGNAAAAIDATLDASFLQQPQSKAEVVTALGQVVKEEVIAALRKPFQKLINLIIGALNKVLDIPRNALVAAVGSIPFVGGILSGALNFLLGILVEKLDGLIGDFLMEIAETGVGDTLDEVFKALRQKMTGSSAAAVANQKAFDSFMEMVKTVLGDLTTTLTAAKNGLKQSLAQNIAGGVAAVAGNVIKQVISKINIPDPAVKHLVLDLLDRAQGAATTLSATPVQVRSVVRTVAQLAAPVGAFLIRKIPGDAALTRMLSRAHTGVVNALEDITKIKDDPFRAVSGLAEISGDYLKEKTRAALGNPSLGPERDLVGRGIDSLVGLLANEWERNRLFKPGSPPAATTVLGKIADLAQPYLAARLGALVQGTGLEKLVGLAVNALFGAEGPVRKGAAFFAGLPNLLTQNGQAIAGEVVTALADFLGIQVERSAGGRVSGALVRGLVEAVGNKMKAPGGLQSLSAAGAEGILRMAKDAFAPLLGAILPATARNAQAAPTTALLKTLGDAVLGVLQNPGRLKTQPGEVVAELAGALARGLKDLVGSAVLSLKMDAGLQPFVKSVFDGVLDLLSDPKELPKLRGKQALLALQKGAAALLPYLKQQTVAATHESVKEIVGALFDDLADALKSPESIEKLVSGKARDYLARAAKALGPPLAKLLLSPLPAAVKTALQPLADRLVAALANPAALAGLSPSTLASTVLAEGKAILKALLATVPDAPAAEIDSALQSLRSGAAAVKAIDQVLVPVLVRIEAPAPRELAIGLAGVLREIVTGKTNNLWARISQVAVRFGKGLAVDAVPSGGLRELVFIVLRGVQGIFAHPQGPRAGLEQGTDTFIHSVAARIGGYLQEVIRARVPDPALSALVGGLVNRGLAFVFNPKEWAALAQEGIGAVLRALAPVGGRFVVAAIAQAGRITGDVRAFLESFVRATVSLMVDPKLRAELTSSSAAALVRAGLRGLKGFLKELLDRATGTPALGGGVAGIIEKAIALFLDPQARSQFFAMSAPQAFAAASSTARWLVNTALAAATRDPNLAKLAGAWLSSTTSFVQKLLENPRDVATPLRNVLARELAPAVAAFVKSQAQQALARSKVNPEITRALLAAYDQVSSFGIAMIAGDAQAQARLTPKSMLTGVFDWVLSMVRVPLEKAITAPPIRAFVMGLLESLRDVLADPEALVAAVRGGAAGTLQLFLPKLAAVLDGLIQGELLGKALANAGIFKEMVRILANEALDLLRTPAKLLALIDDIKGGAARWKPSLLPKLKGLVLNVVEAFRAGLPGELVEGMKAGVNVVFQLAGK